MKISLILPYYNRKPYLKATLETLHFFYGKDTLNNLNYSLEIVIVDDCSSEFHRIEDLVERYLHVLDIKIIRLVTKDGSNPCKIYNIGVRNSSGEIIVMSSPETLHTCSLFELANFRLLRNNQYYCFSVFCPTSLDVNNYLLSEKSVSAKMRFIASLKPHLTENIGKNGRESFANEHGSWYLHSRWRPSHLNFLTAMRRELYFDISGFDERFRKSTGFDDNEFLDRLLPRVGDNILYFDDACAFHLNHSPVYGHGDPVGNQGLYNRILTGKEPRYQPNDDWGKIP